jgi:hypothetical protein
MSFWKRIISGDMFVESKDMSDNERAILAKSMLDNPIFCEAVKEMERELFGMWRESHVDDLDGREDVYVAFQAIQKLRLKLESYANKVRFDEIIQRNEKEYKDSVI